VDPKTLGKAMQALWAEEQQRLPGVRVDLSYGMISLGSTVLWSVLSGWLLYFYLPPEGEGRPLVPAALLGVALFANRVVDAVIDPPIGYLSDRTHSRWGRRLPFMAASALPMLVFFVLLWAPPVRGESVWNLVYLVVILELYNVAYSFLHIAHGALLPELALSDRHRVRVSAWKAGLETVGMVLGAFVGLVIERVGYVRMALVYAVAMLPLFYAPLFVLRERPERQIAPARRLGFWSSLLSTRQNRAFLIYTLTWALYWGTMTLVPAAIPFIATEICLLTKADTVYFYLSSILVSVICYPLVARLADRMGKWRVFVVSLLTSALVLAGLTLIGSWFPVPLKVQGIVWIVFQAATLSGALVLSSVFAAEVTDYDERLTGQRREGIYYATWGLLDNVVSGAATALVPMLLLLGRSHSDPHGPLGVRLIGVVGGAMLLAASLIFLHYPHRLGPDQGA